MVRARICALLGLGLMLAAASTQAREVQFFVENRLGGDSNVFRRDTNDDSVDPAADGSWELSPRVTVRETGDDLNYDLHYQPTLEQFFGISEDTSGVNGVDHQGAVAVDWRVNSSDTLGANANYRNSRRLRLIVDDSPVDPDPSIIPSDNERNGRARAGVFYRKTLAPDWSLRVDYGFDDFANSRRTVSDTRAHSGSIRTDYVIDALTEVGLSVAGRYRESTVQQRSVPPPGVFPLTETDSTTESYDVSFSIRRALSKTIDVSIQVGPSWVKSDQVQKNVALLDEQFGNNTFSVFAAMSASKRWKKGRFDLGYTRSESGGGGTSTSSIVDAVNANVSHRFNQAWSARAYGSWSHRKEIVRNTGLANDDEIDTWITIWTLERRLTANLLANARFRYSFQERQNDRNSRTNESEVYSGFLSLRYTFDSIVF